MWVAGTRISLTAPCVWALSTDTTQSSRTPMNQEWPSPMMLCIVTQHGGRRRSIDWSIMEPGWSRSTLVGVARSYSRWKLPGLSRTASSWIAFDSGGVRTESEARRPSPSEASTDPLCGVAMHTMRLTNGNGSKK
ncbi:MAG: hypothetical protein DWH83_01775 [Planctomycetota bacterium]|nr:MAG: hypothetical protein DWH83_01775 [Planctomycetota bacterium]